MKLTWLGHSCFVIESDGYRIVLDPYYVETYPRCAFPRMRRFAPTGTATTALPRR